MRRAIRVLLTSAGAIVLGAPTIHAQTAVDFPLGVGIHVPSYDRVDGLNVPFGPTISLGNEHVVVEPTLTYRSHLGNIDPELRAHWNLRDSALALSITGSRGTFTNDRWIRSDLINSVTTLGVGHDSRNYFRADRVEARLTLTKLSPRGSVVLYAGPHFENAWSTGWRAGERGGPYSLANRGDTQNGIDRPNPLIDRGHIGAAIAGIGGAFKNDLFSSDIRLRVEAAWHTPLGTHFQQYTLYEEGKLNTVAGQHVDLAVHGITTTGGTAPRQRYAYIGGSGTLATIDLMSLGGDRMYVADAFYVIPLPGIELPLVGGPFIAPHYAIGAAGIGVFGIPTSNVGLRLGFGPVSVDYLINPRTHKHDFSYGLSFSR